MFRGNGHSNYSIYEQAPCANQWLLDNLTMNSFVIFEDIITLIMLCFKELRYYDFVYD